MGYTKIIQSGREIEYYEYDRELPQRKPRQKRKRDSDLFNLQTTIRRRDNSSRQKQNFIRLVKANLGGDRPPSLLTLTMREVRTLAYSNNRFHLFLTKLRQDLGKTFRFIAVPEFQKRGAVHYHVLIWGLDENLIKTERSTRYFARRWNEGFVDLSKTDGRPNLAGYLGKYMAKTLSDSRLAGKKAYSCSRNVFRPVHIAGRKILPFSAGIWGVKLSTATPRQERKYGTQWLGECRYRLFVI